MNKQILFILLLLALNCKNDTDIKVMHYTKHPSATNENTHYILGIHPLHNPELLTRLYLPLINYLNDSLNNVTLSLETSRDYSNYEQKYKDQKFDFLIPNPYQTIEAITYGYKVFLIMGVESDFKGLIIVHRDSLIQTPLDLKGKKICYPAATALAACIMPQYFLFKNGLDINNDIETVYVGSQESSIMNVYLGTVSAGGTWPVPWNLFKTTHPEESDKLRIAWETETLPNISVMSKQGIPDSTVAAIKKILLQIDKTKRGQQILNDIGTKKFQDGSNKSYDVVKQYVARFERDVRPISVR
jgi:phosphonate transport system substrate-binding protein